MLGDTELTQAEHQLEQFTLENERYLKTHNEVLDKYRQLMEAYKRLKSDYEEERDSREKYKQMARGQERNPFVLILVDGDGYIFDDDLVGSGGEGGSRAAQLLNDTVKRSLRGRGLEHCRIMVRIYANLAGLSKAVSKTKLCGPEKRSLSPFVANFNRTNELFDFVDAGELKENADFKIRAMFRAFVDNPQCRHIFFAACHDVGYISELTPHINRDRISLVRTYAFHPEFSKLGLRLEDFLNIFRTGPLPTDGSTHYPKPAAPVHSNFQASHHSTPSTELNSSNVCSFYQKGLCRYGKGCKFAHVKVSNGGLKAILPNKDQSPFQMPHLAKNDNDFMSGRSDATQAQIDFVTQLPHEEDIPPSKVPVNKNQQRLDVYIPPATAEERAAFASRVEQGKLCNKFHLNGFCANMDSCPYDHSPLGVNTSMLNCLKFVSHSMPCARGGGCRSLTCLYGHVCQKADCKYRGGKTFCKLPPQAHSVDLNDVEYVPGTSQAKDFAADENSSLNGKNSTSPPEESDYGEETQEGAFLGEGDDAASVD